MKVWMNYFNFLLLFLFCVFAQDQQQQLIPARIHSFKPPFYLVRGNVPFWAYGGSTVITDEYVRLTPLEQSRRGWIWNVKPVMFPAWEVVLTFKVTGGGGLGADGMAFWYTQESQREGPAFGSQETFKGLGITFDTFDNDGLGNNPFVSIFVNDGSWSYDSKDDGKSKLLGGCRAQFRHNQAKAKIRYEEGTITLELDSSNSGYFSECATVTGQYLPTGYFFGVSAETGGLMDNHDVISFETSQIPRFGQNSGTASPPQQQQQQERIQEQKRSPEKEVEPGEVPQTQKEDPAVDELIEKLNKMKKQDVEVPPVETPKYNPPPREKEVPVQSQSTTSQMSQQQVDSILNELNILKSRQDEIQSTLNQLQSFLASSTNQQSSSSLKTLIEQQQTFAEALNRLLISAVKKDDIKQLSGQDINMKRELDSLKDTIIRTINIDNVINKLEGITRTVTDLKSKIDTASQKTASMEKNLRSNAEQLSETIERSTSFGFWTYFIIFQLIFGVAVMWWKKYSDDSSKKLL